MTVTSTDRYVVATVRRVPDRQRREIAHGSTGAPATVAAPGNRIARLAALVLALATVGTLARTARLLRRDRAVAV